MQMSIKLHMNAVSNEANGKKGQRNILKKCQFASKPHVPRQQHKLIRKARRPYPPLLSNLEDAVCQIPRSEYIYHTEN